MIYIFPCTNTTYQQQQQSDNLRMSEKNINTDNPPPSQSSPSQPQPQPQQLPAKRLSYAVMSKPPDNEEDIDYGTTCGFQPTPKPSQTTATSMSRRPSRVPDVKPDAVTTMSRRVSGVADTKPVASMARRTSAVMTDTAPMALPTIIKR